MFARTSRVIEEGARAIRNILRLSKLTRFHRSLIARVVLLFTAFIVTLGGAATILIAQQSARIALVERESRDLAFAMRAAAATRALRKLSDRSKIDGAPSPQEFRAAGSALDDLVAYDREYAVPPDLSQRAQQLHAKWARVAAKPAKVGQISDILAGASSLFNTIDGRSSLATEPDPAVAQLLDAYGVQLPAVEEHADQAAMILLSAIGERRSIVPERIAAAVLIEQARRAYETARGDLSAAAAGGQSSPELTAPMASVGANLKAFVRASSGALSLSANRVRGSPLRASEVAIVAGVDRTSDILAGNIARYLAERAELERRNLFLEYFETVLALLVALLCALVLARTIRKRDQRELRRARAEAERLLAELEQRRALEALTVSEAHFRAAFDRSSIGVAILDRDGYVLQRNAALGEMLGTLEVRQIGIAHEQFASLIAGRLESYVTEFETMSPTGAHVWLEATVSLVRDDEGAPRFAISMLKDVTERKRIADRFRYDATHDSLTGLPNRTLFFERVHEAYTAQHANEGGERAAVLFIDLDEFKFVNDSLGHAVGDQVLVTAAARLKHTVREEDCVARLGGDEFAVLLAARATRSDLETAVANVERALAEPIEIEGREIFATASIGIAILGAEYGTVEEIVRDADTAMYYAKATGRSRSAFFDATMHDRAAHRLDMATQLRRALEREQLFLTYQPVISLRTGGVRSFEVLLRWQHPELGLVSPAEFIELAEEIGLIVPIGRFVLDGACRQLAEWKRSGDGTAPPRLSVNASVREILQPDYVEAVEEIVGRHGLEPGELLLEITETAILSSEKFSHYTLARLKNAGVGLSIDDFGTGYSSLRYLQQFPFDELKIDRSFVGGADGRIASEPIVNMLLALGQACGVSVVAEGVETTAQAARLRALGCQSAQGFLYSTPRRAGEVIELFRSDRKRPPESRVSRIVQARRKGA